MEELILSGYCRCLDAARTVMVEEGEADCLYDSCPHKASCDIAGKIAEVEKNTKEESV